jgi:hypothetical protein
MAASQASDSAPQPAWAQPTANATTPNQYHLHGGGIAVSYYPEGFGVVAPGGAARLVYQDAQRSLNLSGPDVRAVEVPDLGTVVSVTLARTVDVGYTAFSLLVPQVVLPPQPGAVPVHTEGVTTIHRTFLGAIGQAQREAYTVTKLVGTASRGILPL